MRINFGFQLSIPFVVTLLFDVLLEKFGLTRIFHQSDGCGNTAFQPEGVARYSEG
jgi:hypothetical protein